MTFKLLCCDGGGIRGLITAMLIQDLEQSHRIISKADGFAGTSTGGLIALALANDVPITTIVNVYEKDGEQIFQPNGWLLEEKAQSPESAARNNLEALGSGPGFLSCQYKNDGLHDIARTLLHNKCLSDVKKYIAINTARLWDGKSKSWNAATFSNSANNPYRSVEMKDAALATSAAPTYFPPYKIDQFGFFADGGTFANNPCMTAIADALAGRWFNSVDEVRVLSLGTGIVHQGIAPEIFSELLSEPLDWGVTHWMSPWPYGGVPERVPAMALLDLMMAGTSQAATQEATQILAQHQFCRANVILPEPIGLDDWQKVDKLIYYTEKYIKSSDWQQIRAWVVAHWQ